MITKKMTIGEIIKKYPKTLEVFLKHDLPCVGCPAAQWETLEEVAKARGIKLDKLLKDLNKVTKGRKHGKS